MPSVRALDKLHCATCGEVTLHQANVCVSCGSPNTSSGAKPVPRTRLTRNTTHASNYSARAEAASSKRRARAARDQVLRGQR